MIDELFARFDGAFADNTLRAYKSDFILYDAWCRDSGVSTLEPSAEDMASYVEYLALESSSATVRRRITGVSTVLKLSGLEDPTKAPAVLLAMKRMYRKKGRAQQQAIPLTRNLLIALLAVCGNHNRGIRDQVMLRLGYETMRRRAELCFFRFEDLEVLPSGKAALHLNFSKTDQMGQGKLIPISGELHGLLKDWRERAGGSGNILRRVSFYDAIGESLAPNSINRRLKALQEQAGLELNGTLSGHSFRVGAALDLLESGESLEKIMLRGGWQSESTAIKYLRAWQIV
jgi:integrase